MRGHMSLRLARPLAALLVMGLTTSCADRLHEHRLIQPTGGSSQVCLDRCTRLQDECEARQTLREQECAERIAASRPDRELCARAGSGPCSQPESCLGADMSICRRHYEECFTACGGRVEKQLRQWPWASPVQQPQTTAPAKEPTP